MMTVGKYLKAAGAGRNTKAMDELAARPSSLRKAESATGDEVQDSAVRAQLTTSPSGSMAGYEGGRSAYIEMNGAGYQRRPRPPMPSSQPIAPYQPPGSSSRIRVSDYSSPKYHGLTADRDLSNLL